MSKSIRIGGAIILAAGIIGGAFYLRTATADQPGSLEVAATTEGLRGDLAAGDKNGNGIPDWEEELRAMTLRVTDKLPELNTEGQAGAEPKTLTEAFGRTFFEQYARTSASGGLSDTQSQSQFLDAQIGNLASEAADTLLTRHDVVIGERSDAALRAYGNRVAAITASHSTGGEDELTVLDRALKSRSEAELEKLASIEAAYDGMLEDTLATPVPPQLVDAHVALVNAYLAIRNDIRAMQKAFDDPLFALLRIQRYQGDARALYEALSAINIHLYQAGVRYADDEPGAIFKVETR